MFVPVSSSHDRITFCSGIYGAQNETYIED